MGSLVIIGLITLLCIVLAHRLAARKGYNPVLWGVLAALFGPLVFPVLFFLKTRPPASRER